MDVGHTAVVTLKVSSAISDSCLGYAKGNLKRKQWQCYVSLANHLSLRAISYYERGNPEAIKIPTGREQTNINSRRLGPITGFPQLFYQYHHLFHKAK